jgi:hypothetical protein
VDVLAGERARGRLAAVEAPRDRVVEGTPVTQLGRDLCAFLVAETLVGLLSDRRRALCPGIGWGRCKPLEPITEKRGDEY